MTYRDRLISLIGFNPAPNAAEGALSDIGINSTDNYDSANINSVKTAAIQVMQSLITTADTGNGEVGFNIRYDRPSILKLIAQFQSDLGLSTGQPVITGIRPW